MFITTTILDAETKTDAAKENLADMIIGYVIDQLAKDGHAVSTSEDLDDLVQNTRDWLMFRTNPTIDQISDFACQLYYDHT